jgi:hypothetical protein
MAKKGGISTIDARYLVNGMNTSMMPVHSLGG